MPQQEIIEGLKIAVSKGETLKQAMISFYNAGYAKEEIIEAARAIKYQEFETQTRPGYQEKKPTLKPFKTKTKPTPILPEKKFKKYPSTNKPPKIQRTQKVSNYVPQQQTTQPPQQISAYNQQQQITPKKSNTAMIILLIIFILIIGGILVELFLFKEQIADFFNSIF